MKTTQLLCLALAVGLYGCSRYIVRDSRAYQVGEAAAVARQLEAAAAIKAALADWSAGAPWTWERCAELARPALEIDARAVAQSERALAVAEGRPDPGPAPQAAGPETVCGPAPPSPGAEVAPAPMPGALPPGDPPEAGSTEDAGPAVTGEEVR